MKKTIAIIVLSLLWPVLSIHAVEGVGDRLSWISISEFAAVNDKGFSTFVEGLETRSDWIEIHNASRDSINLDGWSLTDDPENLILWPFPEIHIGARQTMLVWASGIQAEDHPENWPYVDDLGYFHTNFRLNGEGDYLAIVSPDLQVVHEYASHSIAEDVWGYPPQKEGVSYGLCAGKQAFLPLPTPGEINLAECLDQCQAPEFSAVGGTFVNSFVLELTCPTPNAEIYYKLDGAEPVDPGRGRRAIPVDPGHGRAIRAMGWIEEIDLNEWTLYTGPVEIDKSVEVTAWAQASTLLPSATVNQSYLALSMDVVSFSSNLPIIIVDTGGASVGGAFKLVKSVFIDTNETGRAHLTDAADFVGRGGLHIRGSSSSGFAKKQYAFETWDLDDEDKDVSILGFPAESDWILYGPSQYDLAIISNALIYELSNQAGRYAPRTRFCEMYLNSDDGIVSADDYIGIYILMEKINRDAERVAVEKLEPWDSTEPRVSGGYILSIDRAGDGSFSTSRGTQFVHVYPKGEDLTATQVNWIQGYFNQLESALYGPDFASAQRGYAQFIDVNSFIDHNILNLLPLNVDAFRLSGYMHKKRGGKLELGPIWDFDRSMNSTDGRDDNPRQWNNFLTYYWWDRLFDDPHFWVQYIDRWFEFRNTVFSMENINMVIDRMVEEIGEAQPRNRERWPQYSPRYGGFAGEIAALKDWLYTRATWIDNEFVRPPVFSVTTNRVDTELLVTIDNPNDTGTIYYTLDGSDPWIPELEDDATPSTVLVPENIAKKKVLVPVGDISEAWKGGDSFDDSAWTTVRARGGFGAIGYDLGTEYDAMISQNLEAQMFGVSRGGRTSCYIRIPFSISADTKLYNSLYLRMRYDDGFIAYLNGVEVARVGIVGEAGWNSRADSEHNALILESFDISDFSDLLVEGANMLAIHGLNVAKDSRDFLISTQLVARERLTPSGPAESFEYTGPITLTQSTRIKSRVRQAQHPLSRWGGIADQVFSVGSVAESLRISELMYHPGQTGSPLDPNAEYLELTNVGTRAINLNQVRLTQGVEFLFPDVVLLPNDYVLVVKDRDAFAFHHDASLAVVLGSYTGRLSNSGERIELVDAEGQTIQTVDYDDKWYEQTDGQGFSLTPIDPADPQMTSGADQSFWRPSAFPGGSPGWDDSGN